jgi:hypothetical protein
MSQGLKRSIGLSRGFLNCLAGPADDAKLDWRAVTTRDFGPRVKRPKASVCGDLRRSARICEVVFFFRCEAGFRDSTPHGISGEQPTVPIPEQKLRSKMGLDWKVSTTAGSRGQILACHGPREAVESLAEVSYNFAELSVRPDLPASCDRSFERVCGAVLPLVCSIFHGELWPASLTVI